MTGTMRIAIVHYHLRPGGVTRIIEQAATALAARGVRIAVLAGGPPPEGWPSSIAVRVVDGLNYMDGAGPDPQALVARLHDAAKTALGGSPDVWHVHNHSLGRNPALTLAVHRLATANARLLLQIHDFPEDGRSANYRALLQSLHAESPEQLSGWLYPTATHVHYAVLNARDGNFVRAAGAGPHALHLLPNPVAAPMSCEAGAPRDGSRRLFLYPTRALRRKNVGELLLWAALASPGDRFATTLAPTGVDDLRVYRQWMAFAQSTGLPVDFEVGLAAGASYPALVRSAHAIVSTSVAEGFGLAFLEPWLAGRPLVGRNLPEITADFVARGVSLQGLYERARVPLAWIGRDQYVQTLEVEMSRVAARYGRSVGAQDVAKALASAVTGDGVDFGRLDEAGQLLVLQRLVADPAARDAILPAALQSGIEAAERHVDANRATVAAMFGLDAYAERLLEIYRALAAAPSSPVQSLRGEAILDAFLAPERFCLLRT